MLTDSEKILQALDSIPASSVSYEEWIHIGMALKAEGFNCDVWDDWSRNDSRYHAGECDRKWNSFENSGIAAGTIFHLAEQYGSYTPSKKWSFDDYLPAEAEGYEQIIADSSPEKDKPYQMAVTYLETLFKPGEIVGYVHSAEFKEDREKWVPANRGIWRNRDDILRDLKKYKKLDSAFGTINEAAGAWIRINPLDGKGAADKNVIAYRYALVEADTMPIEDQKKLLINMRLPIAALVESGGKSVHAIVKIGADSEQEYKQRVSFLFGELAKQNFIVDTANKNPSRLSRLPGAMRAGQCQKLISTNIGCSSWEDWLDFIHGVDDDLPEIDDLWDMFQEEEEMPDEVISSVLYEGGKLMITGDSKSGKTCLSQNLAVCIASGSPWLGKYQCKKGKVLYINLEIRKQMLRNRFKAIFKALDIKQSKENVSNIRPWNLRGKALPLDQLASKVIRRARQDGPFAAIILDPVYKVQQGDENSAEAISRFCNALDKIAEETGAAIIYDHHHPKGDAGQKKAIDRGAGSGVFARDADALIDISNLEPGNDASDLVKDLIKTGEKPMEMSFILRDFPDQPSQKIWFKYPIHYIDSANLLDNCYIEGSAEANFSKNPNRISDDEKRRIVEDAFFACQRDGRARISEMAEYAETTSKTIKKYSGEIGIYDLSERGYVKGNIGEIPDIPKR